jgi:hypothetical protein
MIEAGRLINGISDEKLAPQQIADRVLEEIRELSLELGKTLVPEKAPIYDRSTIQNEKLR